MSVSPGQPLCHDRTVFVVITNYRTPKDTEETILSLKASSYPDIHICVVDNDSRDGSVDYLRSRFADITLIEAPANEGVARAYNRGIKQALKENAGYILILNSDVELDHHCVRRLVDRAGDPDRPVMLAPVMYYYGEREKVWFAGGRIIWDEGGWAHCETVEEFRKLPAQDRFITACAMFITRKTVDITGYYDERYFMYWDDTDYSVSATQAGVDLDMVGDAVLYHKISASSGGVQDFIRPFHAYEILRSSMIFWRKHLGFWKFHRMWCAGHLGKWVNDLPIWWSDPARRPSAEAVMNAFWYYFTFRRDPLTRPTCPAWLRYFLRNRPWVVAELMAFRCPFKRPFVN